MSSEDIASVSTEKKDGLKKIIDSDAPRGSFERISPFRKMSSRMSREDNTQPLVGTKIDEKHKNYVLMYDMLSGIRTTLSRCHAKPSRPIVDTDFATAHKIAFDISGKEMSPSTKYDFKFKEYCPWVFRSLRETFKLDAADYIVSLTGNYVLSELGTPGKSGSFFYFSRDYRFIIKTISHSEHLFFYKILRDYHDYMTNNPNTLICRYYGLYRVKLPGNSKIHFVVMGNVFPPNSDIHRTYDLKGSLFGRFTEIVENKPKVLKDLNFLELNQKIKLGPEKAKLFSEQLKKDSEFLGKMNIMDYSLLLGIHDMSKGNSEQILTKSLSLFKTPHDFKKRTLSKQERKAIKKAISQADPVSLGDSNTILPGTSPKERNYSIFYQDNGGLRATDSENGPLDEIYYLGIIDVLTEYSGVKLFERAVHSTIHPNLKNTISCVPPPMYATRFSDFICSHILAVPHVPKAEEISKSKSTRRKKSEKRKEKNRSKEFNQNDDEGSKDRKEKEKENDKEEDLENERESKESKGSNRRKEKRKSKEHLDIN